MIWDICQRMILSEVGSCPITEQSRIMTVDKIAYTIKTRVTQRERASRGEQRNM